MSEDNDARAQKMVAETPKLPEIDVSERAGHHTGNPRSMNRRLFMQLLVYRAEQDAHPDAVIEQLSAAFEEAKCPVVLYRDINDPRGVGVLTWSEDPSHFVTTVRAVLLSPAGQRLALRDDFTMLGRSYAVGYEEDLEYWLLKRPVDNVIADELRWAVWYPLRRIGAFERLPTKEQAGILREHAAIGRAYGEKALATDIRLACHGIDAKDNEFVIGLVGKDLHPLSHLVQRMRRTVQTSEYIQHMGPFFVGYVTNALFERFDPRFVIPMVARAAIALAIENHARANRAVRQSVDNNERPRGAVIAIRIEHHRLAQRNGAAANLI